MASYPTAVKSFTTKNAGEKVQAAHVNDLQDEVSALESGLLNGLQHGLTVSTGGLTVSTGNTALGGNLQVNGTSTFAGAVTCSAGLTSLQVSGGSTLAGPLVCSSAVTFNGPVSFSSGVASTVSFASSVTFNGNVTVVGTLTASLTPGAAVCRVTHSADSGIANNVWTGLNWDTETYDSTGMHSTASNSSRITFAGSTGVYHVGAAVTWRAGLGSGGARVLRLMLNDAAAVTATMEAGRNELQPQTVSADLRVADTTDYVTVQVFEDLGSTHAVTNSTQYATAFWAHRVST